MAEKNNNPSELTPIRSKAERIPDWMLYPSFNDERFKRAIGGVSIYLAEGLETTISNGIQVVEGATYNFANLLRWEFDGTHQRKAVEDAITEVGTAITPAYYESYLRRLFEDPTIQLLHIVAGVVTEEDGEPYEYRAYGTFSEHYDKK